jgi:hypothetical protein
VCTHRRALRQINARRRGVRSADDRAAGHSAG